MVASGMGMINNNDSTSELKIASIRILKKSECKQLLESTFTFSYKDGIICAKSVTNTCQGDSGGPVVANIRGQFTLIGITSFGKPCESNQAGFYTDVSNSEIRNFINSVN